MFERRMLHSVLLVTPAYKDATIHNLDVLIYCHLCITIQRYISRYTL